MLSRYNVGMPKNTARILLLILLPALSIFATCQRSGADSALPSEGPQEQLRQIEQSLRKAEFLIGHPPKKAGRVQFALLEELEAISARYELFEIRHDQAPNGYPEWKTIEALAKSLRSKVETRIQEPNALYIERDALATELVTLLELSGSSAQALARSRFVRPGGGCGNWIASIRLAAHRKEAGVLQRLGRYEEALTAMKKAKLHEDLSLGIENPDAYALLYGYLLIKNKQTSLGEEEYQRIVDLFPGSSSADIAKTWLKKSGRLLVPTADRLLKAYDADDFRLSEAMVKHRFPESKAFILTKLSSEERGGVKAGLVGLLGELNDPSLVPLLEENFDKNLNAEGETCNDYIVLASLQALHAYGNHQHILEFLKKVAEGKCSPSTFYLDSELAKLFPDSDLADDGAATSVRERAQQWSNWLRKNRKDIISSDDKV